MSTVQKVMTNKFEKTGAMAGSIKPSRGIVGTKDMRTKNQKLQDGHLIQFEVAQKSLFDKALEEADNERTMIATLQQRKRADNRNKLRENQDFMREWEEEGRQNWKQNQRTRADNIAR